jgi:tRNA U34 5-carboxymethylaminomethyl modifying GTPase MnmE/TrmE
MRCLHRRAGCDCGVRVSGDGARDVFEKIFRHRGATESHRLYYGDILDDGSVVDEAMAVFMAAPKPIPGRIWRNSIAMGRWLL